MAHPDFIEVYDGALDAATCKRIVQRFDASGQAQRGETGSGVNVKLKDSWDIRISGREGWGDIEQTLNMAMLAGLKSYLRKYAHAVLAPLQLQMPDPKTGELATLDAERVAALDDATLNALVFRVFRPGSINLQKYIADQGGYPYWHCELYPKADNGETLHRVVLWSVYLNEGFAEGETEFLYQERRIVPKIGSLLIAPTAFTHTHRGNMPKGGDKYIATSWVLFNRAEQLYANPQVPQVLQKGR
ncbi:2OG-Fe(II) oxygenase [Tahibacter soli]|uniref:2OG-Fe(II) oxygenase n=1 Tax=Tahibacter soli TaxID=2983605 RepID=A0A9X4BJ81_9GAMM|nr:2OG-Fe(II) oxygenase [Tahibacter soli]MDC8014368.1 2OG-Fe(II) oxygenase [Tahibacter soli]